VKAVCVAGRRPPTVALSGPLYPTRACQLTGEPFELTSVAVPKGTGLATSGMRTLCPPPASVIAPPTYLPIGAVVRVNDTSVVFVWPGAIENDAGETAMLTPVRDAATVYAAVRLSTFVTRRFTVWTPARSPIAIDGTFMSLRSNE